MIEEPKPLTIKKNWERPSKKQLKAFENIPTGFVTDALNGEGTLSIDIKPVGDGRDINCVVVGAAVTAGNNACLLYTSPSPRDRTRSRMPSSA